MKTVQIIGGVIIGAALAPIVSTFVLTGVSEAIQQNTIQDMNSEQTPHTEHVAVIWHN